MSVMNFIQNSLVNAGHHCVSLHGIWYKSYGHHNLLYILELIGKEVWQFFHRDGSFSLFKWRLQHPLVYPLTLLTFFSSHYLHSHITPTFTSPLTSCLIRCWDHGHDPLLGCGLHILGQLNQNQRLHLRWHTAWTANLGPRLRGHCLRHAGDGVLLLLWRRHHNVPMEHRLRQINKINNALHNV